MSEVTTSRAGQVAASDCELLPSMAEIVAGLSTTAQPSAAGPDAGLETTIATGLDDIAPDAVEGRDAGTHGAAASHDRSELTPSTGARHRPRVASASDFDLVRPALFIVSLFAILISMAPFTDRSGKSVISTLEAGSLINQVFFPALLLAMLFAVGVNNLRVFWSFARWPYVAFSLWLLPATIWSLDPTLSARRVIFFMIQVAIAALAMLLPRSQRQLAWMLFVVAALIVALSYIGVATLPHLSIHQPTDAVEIDLAGDWRGIFRHKNEAGAVMVVIIFMALYVARTLDRLAGVTLAVLAVGFLALSHSKSSAILLPFSLVFSYLVERCRTTTQRAALVLGLVALFNVATLGSSFPGPIRTTLTTLMPDVTFTGRTDLWRYAIESVAKRPLVGYGIGAFWRTGAMMHKDREEPEPEDTSGWVTELGTDSHNGYLDVAVSTGIPGLVLLLLAIVVFPLRDISGAFREPANRDLARFYLRCWVFVLFLSGVESLLMPLNPIWYVMLQSVFGLQLLAHYRLTAAHA